MKPDYCKIKENECGKYFYNEKDLFHRLNGPAIEYYEYSGDYYINNINYIEHFKCNDEHNELLYIYTEILELIPEYEFYIKKNLKKLIKRYNPEINLYWFDKSKISELPDWLKDLIIL